MDLRFYEIQSTKKNNRVPWSQIATSIPFWALLITHTLNNFGWYMLLVELPMFLSVGLGFAIKDVSQFYFVFLNDNVDFNVKSSNFYVNSYVLFIVYIYRMRFSPRFLSCATGCFPFFTVPA